MITHRGGCHCGAVRFAVEVQPFDGRNWERNAAALAQLSREAQ